MGKKKRKDFVPPIAEKLPELIVDNHTHIAEQQIPVSGKQQAVDEARAADEAAVFEQFQDLNGIEAFEKLRENCAELSIEEIEDKCFAIRGRNASVHTFSNQKTKLPRQPVTKTGSDEPYGGLFVEFPPNR